MQRVLVRLATLLTAGALVATSALSDLRSPDGTAALGARLAEEAVVRALVADAIVEAVVDDARTSAPAAAPLLPLVRPLLEQAVTTTLDGPAGRAALADAFTAAIQQATFAGPLVLDLAPAVLAAAEVAPEPLDTLARSAVERGVIGTVVLGDTPDGAVPTVPDAAALGRIAGLDADVALAAAAMLLLAVLAVTLVPDGRRRGRRLRAAGWSLVTVGAPVTLLLRADPTVLVGPLTDRLSALVPDAARAVDVDGIVAVVTEGFAALLARTADVTLAVTAVGVVLIVAGLLPRRRTSSSASA
jgi:hypothetical protein